MSLFRNLSFAALGIAGLAASAAAAPARMPLPSQIPTIVKISQPVGPTADAQSVSLALVLPRRNQAELERLLKSLYDPASPLYGQYLTTEEFTARFGPTQKDYDAVIAFVKSQGLTIRATHPSRTLLDVSGSAKAVETAFAVRLQNYESPSGRIFHAPTGTPSIPAIMAGHISGIVGLENGTLRHTNLTRKGGAAPLAGVGTSLGGGLAPSDIRTAYNLDTLPQNGAGQTLAVFELDSYAPKDVLRYERLFSLPVVPLEDVRINTTDPDYPLYPGGGTAEVVLDIDMQIALAPKAAKVLVYISPNTSDSVVDLYQKIADDNRAKSISTSWALSEDIYIIYDAVADYVVPEYYAFQQMAAQGQSIFASSGDNGGVDRRTGNLSVEDPASQPYMCGVGGTTLSVKNPGTDEHYLSETTWNTDGFYLDGAGGGGVSYLWSAPDYQQAALNLAPASSGVDKTMRNVPDVSLNADPNTGYLIYVSDPSSGPGYYIYGGTSAAAPLWAGFTALVNQKRASLNKSTIGFINPPLYKLGPGGKFASRYSSDFHDIADGSDNIPYVAVKGYDAATGLGTMKGASLLSDLSTKF